MEITGQAGCETSGATTVMKKNIIIAFLMLCVAHALAQTGKRADKPLFRDPIYDGAADPVVVWNKAKKKWWMFYTNRRAASNDTAGVRWCHGTRIGIAESEDGAHWKYVDTADIG